MPSGAVGHQSRAKRTRWWRGRPISRGEHSLPLERILDSLPSECAAAGACCRERHSTTKREEPLGRAQTGQWYCRRRQTWPGIHLVTRAKSPWIGHQSLPVGPWMQRRSSWPRGGNRCRSVGEFASKWVSMRAVLHSVASTDCGFGR